MVKIEIDEYGGILLTAQAPVVLSEEVRAAILEKWEDANDDGEVEEILAEMEKVASPKAYLLPAYVADKDDAGAVLSVPFDERKNVEEKTFRLDSPLICEKIEKDTRVIATLATCGREVHNISMSKQDDPLLRIVAEDLCLEFLRVISLEMHEYIRNEIIGSDKFSRLNPGSLPAWPITAQPDLFAVIGKGAELTGVELTPSYLMIPYKSSSGLVFPTENRFESCMRCPRLNCPGRRAPYEES